MNIRRFFLFISILSRLYRPVPFLFFFLVFQIICLFFVLFTTSMVTPGSKFIELGILAIPSPPGTAVFFHRYVKTRRTDTFSMVLGGPGHVQSMAKKSKIIPGAPFFKIPFFWGLLVQVIKFSLFFKSSLVLLVTFKRIKLEMLGWSHFKDLFRTFPTVTNFLWIRSKISELWPAKHELFHGDYMFFTFLKWGFFFNLLSFVNYQT